MLAGGLGGLLLGGLIGSLLFGGMPHGLFGGGIGLMELLLLAGLGYFAFSILRRRSESVAAGPPGYASQAGRPAWEGTSPATATMEAPAGTGDLERGLAHVRQMDPGFDRHRFAETASDIFFKVQAAWMARELAGARHLLTAEMLGHLQADCDRLRAERRLNRLEQVAVRAAEVTEAWQEAGHDYLTVRFLASVLDYTVDERTGEVVQGSPTDPVKFEEYWTFTRPVGPGPWQLSAIQQAGEAERA
jgi:predicted lipid-binding transport protein (Tim44 family)